MKRLCGSRREAAVPSWDDLREFCGSGGRVKENEQATERGGSSGMARREN